MKRPGRSQVNREKDALFKLFAPRGSCIKSAYTRRFSCGIEIHEDVDDRQVQILLLITDHPSCDGFPLLKYDIWTPNCLPHRILDDIFGGFMVDMEEILHCAKWHLDAVVGTLVNFLN